MIRDDRRGLKLKILVYWQMECMTSCLVSMLLTVLMLVLTGSAD